MVQGLEGLQGEDLRSRNKGGSMLNNPAHKGLAIATLSTAGALAASLLMALEGYSSKPYQDVAGIWTNCYGNTHGVVQGVETTPQECKRLLDSEVGRIATMLYKDQPKHNTKTLASGISFVYNVGDGAYKRSTYRKRLLEGDFTSACHEMSRWVYARKNGVPTKIKGLVNRRNQEVQLCLEGVQELSPLDQ